MTNYPTSLDDDTSLPPINDNLLTNGADAINAERDAIFALEQVIGTGAVLAGASMSLADRVLVMVNTDGSVNSSLITGLGLVTLPIYNNQIAPAAAIDESKLSLNYTTLTLFDYYQDLSKDVNLALGWISGTGVKLDPHLMGLIYRHDLLQIDVIDNSSLYLNNVFRVNRDNSNAYTLLSDMNSELLSHQWSDGYIITAVKNIVTNSGGIYPSNFAHTASGLFVDTSGFAVIPQTDNSVQAALDYIDANSIFLLGTRIQNLYHNGISKNSRSSSLSTDGYGSPLVSWTPAVAYFRGLDNRPNPIDDISTGDDIIQFLPPVAQTSNFSFDERFLQTRVGDIVRVNYAADGYNVIIQSIISEIKYAPGVGLTPSTFMVRIAGKNIAYSPNAIARIDRCLFNNNKQGVLALANVNTTGIFAESVPVMPSLIVGNPRGAQCLGVGFSPDEFNETHYLLYLVLYPDGNPLHGAVSLQAIDVTGNQGITPGSYTLESIVEATNNAFRAPGFNHRFIAFSYQGEFGIMLADSYTNASFSIISAAIDSSGSYILPGVFVNNVIDMSTPSGADNGPDPLGFGPAGANVASVPFQSSFTTPQAAQYVTQIFAPLRRNNYYVNGAESERMKADLLQLLDGYGDGYWLATIDGYTPSVIPTGHKVVQYQVLQDLSTSRLKPGKTIVVRPLNGASGGIDYGRFIIQDVQFNTCGVTNASTLITVYDAVHNAGSSPQTTAAIGTQVALYFDADSVSFDFETATDISTPNAVFKRFFEVYIDDNEQTFTHERARFSATVACMVNGVPLHNTLALPGNIDLVSVSSKLRGYQVGLVNKITLNIVTYDRPSGIYSAYLCIYDTVSSTFKNAGPTISGKVGETTRFYDESNIDFIDIKLPIDVGAGFGIGYFDIQLFPTLSLDEEVMLLGTCQVDNGAQTVSNITDCRQFGNISEEELSTSAKSYISLPEKLLHFNGVIRGFDIAYITNEFVGVTGGLALVDGEIAALNKQVITVPKITELYSYSSYPVIFALCANSQRELVLMPVTDSGLLSTPTADRVMTVTNVVSSRIYDVDSEGFSGILNNRKDLTVLYLIASTVTGTGSSATVSLSTYDVRRYVNDADSSTQAVLTNGNSQGNFRSLAAAIHWMGLNSAYQNNLRVKGTFAVFGNPFTFTQAHLNISAGGNNDALTFASHYMSLSNITFENLNLSFALGASFTNVTFNNCTISFNTPTLNNVTVNDSVMTVNTAITNSGPATFNDCTINVPIARGFNIGNGLAFYACTFNYTYSYSGTMPTNGDLVFAGDGMMYASITGSLVGLTVSGCTFNNTALIRYPFIGIRLGGSFPTFSYGAYAQNIDISGNSFNSQTNTEDVRAVIAITSTITTATLTASPVFPKLVNVNISDNVCNFDQMILVSTVRNYGLQITGAMLACTNCKISGNVCGAIGYITAGDFVSNNDNSDPHNLGYIRDKMDQLIIEKNTCKLIANLDATGKYIAFADGISNWVEAATGGCSIINNIGSWILAGVSVFGLNGTFNDYNVDGALISHNRLTPYDPDFLRSYKDVGFGGNNPPNVGILLRADVAVQSDYVAAPSIISENILQSRAFMTDAPAPTFYNYDAGIQCENSANIIGNTLTHCVASPSHPMILLGGSPLGGPTINVHDNILSRGSNQISAYVQAKDLLSANLVSITDNIFDSTILHYTPAIPPLPVLNDIPGMPTVWAYTRNTNQVCYAAVPMYNYNSSIISANGNLIDIDNTSNLIGIRNSTSSQTDGQSFMQFYGHIADVNATVLINMSGVLPTGVKLLYATLGLTNTTGGGPATDLLKENANSAIFMELFRNISSRISTPTTIQTAYTKGAPLEGSIVQVGINSTVTRWAPPSAGITLDVIGYTDITAATIYLNIDMSDPACTLQVYTGRENEYILSFNLDTLQTTSAATQLNMSPLILRYAWC